MRGFARQSVVSLTALVFSACLLLPVFARAHLQGPVDPDWGALVPRGGASGPRLGTPASVDLDHCAVCHWLRALSNAAPASPLSPGPAIQRVGAVELAAANHRALWSPVEPPARAPPASV